MKNSILLILFLLVSVVAFSQEITDLKTKTTQNQVERTAILDAYRAKLKKEFKQEFKFIVRSLKTHKNYAWLMVDVTRKDGREVDLNSEEAEWDCCHAEALLKKTNGKWQVIEHGAFSTDVWWGDIWNRHTTLPKDLFQ